MKARALWTLIQRDLIRVRGALVTSGFGIAAGTATLVFFLALGLGVRSVLLGDVFPIDQVELEPPKGADPGLVGIALGIGADPPGVSKEKVDKLRGSPLVKEVYPKLMIQFPLSGHGEIAGMRLGAPEIVADGIEASMVEDELDGVEFRDPLLKPGKKCTVTAKLDQCDAPDYCEGRLGEEGVCVKPVPVLVSRYMVEFFDKTIAPAHGKPPMGETIVEAAKRASFMMWLGESMIGKSLKSNKNKPRHARLRVAGISRKALDIGVTLPLDVVKRWNVEYAGEDSAKEFSSVVVRVKENDELAAVIALGAEMDLHRRPTGPRARACQRRGSGGSSQRGPRDEGRVGGRLVGVDERCSVDARRVEAPSPAKNQSLHPSRTSAHELDHRFRSSTNFRSDRGRLRTSTRVGGHRSLGHSSDRSAAARSARVGLRSTRSGARHRSPRAGLRHPRPRRRALPRSVASRSRRATGGAECR